MNVLARTLLFVVVIVATFSLSTLSTSSARAQCAPGDDCEGCELAADCGACRQGCGLLDRGTLMQWSYGTSFDGGPPSMDEPLATDRPDFTEASTTVGRGVAQLEFGYTYIYNDDNGETTKSHSIGEPLLRVGVLAEWLELRIATNWVQERERAGGAETSLQGTEDLYLGVKFGLTPQEGLLPEMALVPQVTVPTGSGDITNDEALPGLNWLYGWDITDGLSTAGSTQVNRALDDATNKAYLELAQSWTVALGLTDAIGAYTEWFAFIPSGADTDHTEHYVNGGFTWLVTNNLQFDIRAGYGLNAAADDYFTGAGGAVRF